MRSEEAAVNARYQVCSALNPCDNRSRFSIQRRYSALPCPQRARGKRSPMLTSARSQATKRTLALAPALFSSPRTSRPAPRSQAPCRSLLVLPEARQERVERAVLPAVTTIAPDPARHECYVDIHSAFIRRQSAALSRSRSPPPLQTLSAEDTLRIARGECSGMRTPTPSSWTTSESIGNSVHVCSAAIPLFRLVSTLIAQSKKGKNASTNLRSRAFLHLARKPKRGGLVVAAAISDGASVLEGKRGREHGKSKEKKDESIPLRSVCQSNPLLGLKRVLNCVGFRFQHVRDTRPDENRSNHLPSPEKKNRGHSRR
ncbi:hypothetical protein B0H19DRAFT_1077386 [Mycena capillaripes]|nr:hypothetical protein B0H19DRAFT_1077386 [Mycena capillaripes]